ncbi:MAG: hypothetical protein Q8J67_06180, partial [Rhodocyclaceae bacterium]|nr:hypothetical protein [Rhodocyclaceae bacterium]
QFHHVGGRCLAVLLNRHSLPVSLTLPSTEISGRECIARLVGAAQKKTIKKQKKVIAASN